jgi:hypothetical protein
MNPIHSLPPVRFVSNTFEAPVVVSKHILLEGTSWFLKSQSYRMPMKG